MKKAKFSEQQIISILKEAEAGVRVSDFAGRMASVNQPSIAGKRSMVAWMSQR